MGAVYCENTDIAPKESEDTPTGWKIGDSLRRAGAMPCAVDPQAADRLWSLSEQLIFGGRQS